MYFVVYQDSSNEWRWRLKAGNHEIIADSGEAYVTKVGAENGIRLVKSAGTAPTIDG